MLATVQRLCRRFKDQALVLAPLLSHILEVVEDRVETGVRRAIAGNVVDLSIRRPERL
ncbi:MAG: hypothetical protein AB7W28_05395 [Armatimonadota bacterium]